MYYKVLPDCDLYNKLDALKREMKRCNTDALDLAKSIGYDQIRLGWFGIAGGISAFQIEGLIPKGWKRASKKAPEGAFFPKEIAANKDLLELIKNLPKVSSEQLADIVNFKEYLDEETHLYYKHPFASWKTDIVLLKIAEIIDDYVPVEGMIEITQTEFNAIKEQPIAES